MITPLQAFIAWFDNTPVALRQYLAHIFQVCTTENTSLMVVNQEQSLENFKNWLVKKDFPLRVTAKMFYVRSIFDMVIIHYKEILKGDDVFNLVSQNQNIVKISLKQWEKIFDSWIDLRKKEMSDTYIHSWTSAIIKLTSEEK